MFIGNTYSMYVWTTAAIALVLGVLMIAFRKRLGAQIVAQQNWAFKFGFDVQDERRFSLLVMAAGVGFILWGLLRAWTAMHA